MPTTMQPAMPIAMKTRKLGPFTVANIGLGCMSMSHAYGKSDKASAIATLHRALDVGYNFLDTAALYGFGANENLLGEVLHERRDEFVLASKCGLFKNSAGEREINGRPEVIKQTCEDSLNRLKTDVIDLYYLHRVDPNVPVEDSIGALSELVAEGKIKTIGLSEVSAQTLKRAHAVHPITALQSEYSLWTRNPEGAVLETCKQLGVAFVAFSPLARGFLTGHVRDMNLLQTSDLRHSMPRFLGDNFSANLQLLESYSAIATANRCSPAQLALAWLLNKDEIIIPIPGTQHGDYAVENAGASHIQLSDATMVSLEQLINVDSVQGERYNASMLATMET